MQIGGSIGLSVFTAIYASAIGGLTVTDEASQLEAFTTGYSATFIAAAVGMVIASVVAAFLIRAPKSALLPQGMLP